MLVRFLVCLCYLSMLYAFICGLRYYRRLDLSFRILTWLLGATFFVEGSAYVLAYSVGSNLPLYNVFLLVQFLLTALYFNFSIDTFRRRNIGIRIGIAGVALGMLNCMLFQSLHKVGSYFLLFAGITVISLSLYSFARSMLIREDEEMQRGLLYCPHFWIAVSLTFFWSTSFLLWGLYEYFIHYSESALPVVHVAIRLVNILTYTAIGSAILLYHHNLRLQHARR